MTDADIPLVTVPIGGPLEALLDVIYAARQTPLLSGGTGVGKSTQLESYAAKRGWGFRARDLSLMEPPDLVGLPKLDGAVTRYLPPVFLPTEADDEGLLVLEEINRAPAYMRAPCLQLLTARRLNDYVLPAKWRLAAAINPAEDGYAADELDPALEARFVRVNVVADPNEWAAWAAERKVDRQVVDYVLSDPTVFDSPMSNPRAWTMVARIVRAADKLETAAPLLRAAVAGCVGAERAAAFLRFVRDRVKPLDADAVLTGYKEAQPVLRQWVADGQLDLVQGTLLNVKRRLQSRTAYETVRRDRTAWRNLGRLLNDMPGDLREDADAFFREYGYDAPRTVEAAVDLVLSRMSAELKGWLGRFRGDEDELRVKLAAGFIPGAGVRAILGLWGQNPALLALMPRGYRHPDDASAYILVECWRLLRAAATRAEPGDAPGHE